METKIPTNHLSEVDWEDILETLKDQRCMLFLGSSIFEAAGGGSMEQALVKWLDADNPNHPHIHLRNQDGFYLFRKSRFRRKVIAKMKEFYNQPFPETQTLFSRIARIPFQMIFTLTPDNILARTYDEMGLDYQPDFYFRNRRASEHFEKPRRDKPLIYNLLGNIEEPESIILTHKDFFDFLQSIFKANSMHEDLKDQLEKMDRYVFLGLPYEKWYFQLLLRVLSLHNEKLKEIERLALKEFENPNLHKLYTKEFKLEFFPVEMEAFIGELFHQCEATNLLKPLPNEDFSESNISIPTKKELKEWVAGAKIKKAMKHLKFLLIQHKPRSYALSNDLIVLRNRFNLLKQREIRGTIDSRDFSVENNQITELLLELIDKSFQLG